MDQHSEQDWVERARQGDPQGTAKLFRRYWRAARATAYGITGDFGLAEDAASEAFCAALQDLGTLKDPTRFGPWLRTITLRTAKHLLQAHARAQAVQRQKPSSTRSDPGMRMEQHELASLIHEAVGNLPDHLREIMCLFYFEGYELAEAARFLDVPLGTLKRRLHEGRQRLRRGAEQLLKGQRPMNPQREQILQQLREWVDADKDMDKKAFLEFIPQVMRLRPPPVELLRQLYQKHWSKVTQEFKRHPHKENAFRNFLGRHAGPSERALDPTHPVGALALALRKALPEFVEWQVDPDQIADRLLSEARFNKLPPGWAEGKPSACLRATRGLLMIKADGSDLTREELMQLKPCPDREHLTDQQARLSDVLDLSWLHTERIELRAVEDLLLRLARTVVPQASLRILSHEVPMYRAALRVLLNDCPMSGAIGGVLYPSPELPEGVGTAHTRIFLEPWATARSGQIIELHTMDLPDSLSKNDGDASDSG